MFNDESHFYISEEGMIRNPGTRKNILAHRICQGCGVMFQGVGRSIYCARYCRNQAANARKRLGRAQKRQLLLPL